MVPSRIFLSLFVWLLPVALCHVNIYPDDPYSDVLSRSDFVPPEEPYTNLTMDQLISQAYGGSEAYMSDYFMDPSGNYLAEMDMRLEPDQFDALYGDSSASTKRKKRKATRPLRYRWTNKVMPYEFAPGHFNSQEVYTVKKALQEWSDATCMQFRPATSGDRNKVRFQNGAGCNSALGMVGGTQAINLQSPSCRYKGLYLHEVGHALGLVHEHQLPDRDAYIYILLNNVSPGLRIWFNKYSTTEVNQYGVPYEYSSVMHYGVTAFSINGRSKTIQTKDPSKESLIGRVYLKGLSFSDIKVVNLMYECNKHCTADPQCQDPGYLNKNCQCVCPQGVDCSTGTGTGGRVTTAAPECTNTYIGRNCDDWATRGECDANPDWMRVNCQRSCGTCPTGTTPTTTTTTTSTTTTTTRAPPTTTYMPSPPPSSTTTGTSSSSSTVHSPSTTPSGASTTPSGASTTPGTTVSGGTTVTVTGPPVTSPSGGSTTSSTGTTTYMPSTAPPTTTTSTTTTTTTTARPCVNSWGNYDCNNWSRIGECLRNRDWMRQHCALACDVCSGGTGGGGNRNCQNRHQYCDYWSRTGWCGRSQYMATNCRRACDQCNA